MQEIQISKNEAGQRLDKLLHKLMPEAGNSFLYKMLRKKNITLNGKKAEGKESLTCGDVVKVFLADDTYVKFGGKIVTGNKPYIQINIYKKAYKALHDIKIIYEDKDVLILNKPSGILSQKSSATDI